MSIFHVEIQEVPGARDQYSVRAKYDAIEGDWSPVTVDVSDDIQETIAWLHEKAEALEPPADIGVYDELCATVGRFLFNAFFVGNVEVQFRRYMGDEKDPLKPRIALHMPRSLYYLPWELLVDPHDKLMRFFSYRGSVVRCDNELSSDHIYGPVQELSLLYYLASPVVQAITAVSLPGNVQSFSPATYARFISSMETVQRQLGFILHGHGDLLFPPKTPATPAPGPESGRFNFVDDNNENDPYDGQAVAGHILPTLRLAIVVACESAWTSSVLRFEKTFVGGLFTRSNLDIVLGMQRVISALAADSFLRAMVTYLSNPKLTFDLAVGRARLAIRDIQPTTAERRRCRLNWWIPAIYTKTTLLNILPNPDEFPNPPQSLVPGPFAGSMVARVPEPLPNIFRMPLRTVFADVIRPVFSDVVRRIGLALQ